MFRRHQTLFSRKADGAFGLAAIDVIDEQRLYLRTVSPDTIPYPQAAGSGTRSLPFRWVATYPDPNGRTCARPEGFHKRPLGPGAGQPKTQTTANEVPGVMRPDHVLSAAGVIVALAFFVLVAYVVTVLRKNQKQAAVIAAIAALVGALPAILYALYALH